MTSLARHSRGESGYARLISDYSFQIDMVVGKTLFTDKISLLINVAQRRKEHSIFTTLSTEYDALCTLMCTSVSTRGGWVLPGGGARILRHSLPGQIGVRKSISRSVHTLK